ncbi:MAG: hypothetical protein M3315_10840, partial [Actinomycetota bacterium]|nr:hypothetical protein [Actinomycetota bacterium]
SMPYRLYHLLRCSIILVSLLALGLLVASCSGSQEQQPGSQQQGSSQKEGTALAANGVTEYVGTVQGVNPQKSYFPGDFFIAVAVDEPGNATAYLCDATGNAQLFSGKIAEDQLDLRSQTGEATLSAAVANSTVDGQIELRGATLPFATTKAESIGGLYTFTKAEGDVVTAKSERGNELSAKYLPDEQALQGAATLANGEERSLKASLRPRSQAEGQAYEQQAGFSDYRMIVLDSGIGKGNKTVNSKPAPDETSNFSMVAYTWE